jgi:hypothetical protein
MKSLLA